MSDLFEVREKVEKGANWRGTINVEIDGDMHDLTIRQLRDTEFWDVMSDIDREELQSFQDGIDDDTLEELRELQEKDELTDEEEERIAEIQESVDEDENVSMFDSLSKQTFRGIKKCAIYGVEPDEEDIRHVLTTKTGEIEDLYGGTSHDDAKQYINDYEIEPLIERSTDFTSFAIGAKVLGETLEHSGN